MKEMTRKRLWNTIGNPRWWLVLPLVLPIMFIALTADLLRILGNYIEDHQSSITNFILLPMAWVRNGRKYP